jgi:hypothetical protein
MKYINIYQLPQPRITIQAEIAKNHSYQTDYTPLIHAFQDLRYMGEMKQRWEEIKKLQMRHPVAFAV